MYVITDDVFTDVTAVTVETNSYTPDTDLAEDMMYYWKVIATDDEGGQTESAVFSFWTNSEVILKTFTDPPNGLKFMAQSTGFQAIFEF